MTKITPINVADYLISKEVELGIGAVILQKTVYCAHGWWLAMEGEPLVNECPQAWQLGPVFKTLYYERKSTGKQDNETTEDGTQNFRGIAKKPEEVCDFLDAVRDRYKKFSAKHMINLTHTEGTPWYQTVNKYLDKGEEPPENLVISNDLIKKHFEKIIKESVSHK